jgi:hypothetical protein
LHHTLSLIHVSKDVEQDGVRHCAGDVDHSLQEHLHDPEFWKALATARKWEDVNAWRFHWHRFIDHLADGKDAESFFAAL